MASKRCGMIGVVVCAGMLTLAGAARAVSVTNGSVNGIIVHIWSWTDSTGRPRTVSLKKEGQGNPGHGGYAVQFSYVAASGPVTVNADAGGDGGFGYFVSHERYRNFADGAVDTIASHIFGKDDSPLGLDFAAVAAIPHTAAGTGAERFTIGYGHYGTITPHKVDPNTGEDAVPLPVAKANYAFYRLPATTTWVFQDGHDYPRIDVAVSLADVVPPGGNLPTADLVSFDMRGPYGVMVFDDGADGIVSSVLWGDQQFLFKPLRIPVTRSTGWTWQNANLGARYHTLLAGGFEMGLFEPLKVADSATVDGYAAERGFTRKTYVAAGGTSFSSCPGSPKQVLPSDGTWPYQSLQYSLPCGAGTQATPTSGKKIAWGTTAYYGTSLTGVFNGRQSFPFDGFPAGNTLRYSVCLVLGAPVAGTSLTQHAAATFANATPHPNCATTAVP